MYNFFIIFFSLKTLVIPIHWDKTRVQMPAKIFPHLKVKCYLFMGPTLGFDTKQRNSFFDQIWCFLQLKQDSDNIIYS